MKYNISFIPKFEMDIFIYSNINVTYQVYLPGALKLKCDISLMPKFDMYRC